MCNKLVCVSRECTFYILLSMPQQWNPQHQCLGFEVPQGQKSKVLVLVLTKKLLYTSLVSLLGVDGK